MHTTLSQGHPRHPHHSIGGVSATNITQPLSKDIIFDWFRKLDNWNRIDFMCGILDICHPFEVIWFTYTTVIQNIIIGYWKSSVCTFEYSLI